MAAKRQRLKKRIRRLTHRLWVLTRNNPEAASFHAHVDTLSREATSISSVDLHGLEINGYRYLLYLELLDYARNIAVLLQRGFQSNTPMLLLRGMYEGLADLRNLVNDEQTLQNMKLKYSTERLKILVKARGGIPFLQILVDDDLDDLIAKCQQDADDLKMAGAEEPKIRKRFADAGLTSQYEGEYAFFSEYVHRGLKILENQFINKNNGDWIFPPILEREWESTKEEPILRTAAWILQDARKQLVDVAVLTD